MENLIICSKEINPQIICIIKDRECNIEKLIDHREQGLIVKYSYNEDKIEFCLLTNLPEDTISEIMNKYPEYCM